jgi:hypothetical protein
MEVQDKKDFSTTAIQRIDITGKACLEPMPLGELTKKEFEAKPLKVSEALIYLLEKVKRDPETLNALIFEIAESKEHTPKAQEYRFLLLKLLAETNPAALRTEVEKIADIEKEWVLVENDGIQPSGKIYENLGPTWGQRAWKTTKTVGQTTFSVGCVAGEVTYRIYVEATRIGTIALLGVMIIQNPLFPVLDILVKTLLRVLIK